MKPQTPSDCACLFPMRSHGYDGTGDNRELNAAEIDCQALQEVTGYCDQHGMEIDCFLMGTWAIILKQFTDTTTIHLGFQRFTPSDTTTRSEIGVKSRMQLFSRPLGEDTPLGELFESGQWATAEAETVSFNTGIAMCCHGLMPIAEGISGTAVAEAKNTCDVVLAWQAGCSSGTPRLWLLYKASVLCTESAKHVADSVSHILKCIIQGEAPNNSTRISGLSANQRAKINEWNIDKAGSRASNLSLHDEIHQRYLEDPEKPAICSWDGVMTYSELMDASRRWAFKLRELGAGPGVMIPVCFEKSLWAIVSMLAINRVGAAFVPLDPSHPPDYLRGIIAMLNPPLVLVSPLQDKVLGDVLPCTYAVDESRTGDLPDYGTAPLPSKASDYAGPAYCLFTSGSTGTPKGCVVGHAALASVAGHTAALHLDRSSRALQFASFSFGVSLIEVWCTLCAGGTVCMPSDADRVDRLAATIGTLHVNWAILTPTILDLLQPGTVPGVRNIVVAGEPLREGQKSLWAGSTQLFQGYGLTEWAGIFSVSPQIGADHKVASIGAPPCGSCWLTDPHDPDQLVAIGAVGEVVIEGPSLAQGYLQNPHKTALSFITDPVWALDARGSDQRKRRFYRTGDLAFYHCDGSLQYVGRKDLQVKIRGQRTALSVVEHHLAHGDPAFRGAVVDAIRLAHEDQLRLAAFVPNSAKAVGPARRQGEEGHQPLFAVPDMAFMSKLGAVKRRLTDQLPRYMVPDIFLCVDQLPVTVTGKVARRQLRDQASNLSIEELAALTGLASGGSHAGPKTPQERAIHDLVTQVLKLPSHVVRMEHSFVGLGGDSVLAMKMAASARQGGLALSVKDIFDAPDIRTLAEHTKGPLQRRASGGAIAPFSLVQKEARETIAQTAADLCHVPMQDIEDIFPCTPLQEGMMALGQTNPGTYVARFICQINQQVDIDRLRSAWASVVAANPILRTRIIQTEGSGMHQVVIKQDLQWETDSTWHDYVASERYTVMKLGDPLVRGALLRGPEDPSTMCLVMTMHHSVCDRWSTSLLLDALRAAYHGEAPEKNSFAPFVKYISEIPQSQAREFWAKEFVGLEAEVFPALPSQAHRPCPSESLHLQVTTEPPKGATMSSFIRLAWALVVSQYTAVSDTVFGVTVTGRSAPVDGIEKLPAPTISTAPFRVQIYLNRMVKDAVAAVQQHASEMIPFEQTGLQNIRRYSPEASDACGFQSHLVVQPAWDDNGRWGDFLHLVEDGASVQGGFASYAIVLLCNLTRTSDINITSEFDPDIIPPNIMKHILEHFGHVLRCLLADPGSRLGDIPIGPFDTAALKGWCPAVPPSQPECVHEVIQHRAVESPSACAVDAWDGKLTYAELNGMSTRLSIGLALQGIKQETLVPLCFEKSQWAIVAILAVMKAGAAFVLLDPSQPLQRLQDICSQTNSPVVLASEQNADLAASLKGTVYQVSQRTMRELPASREQQRGPAVRPNTALYVVFTSGSTGTPKGIVVEHQSYHAGSKFHIQGYRMSPQSRVLQFASYAFDTSIIEILSTLMAGACICVPSDNDRQNSLAQVVGELAVTHAFLTPSVARALAQARIHPFEVLILVGEPMTASDVAYWAEHAQLMNGYGPAECSVCATLNQEVGVGSDAHDIGTGVGAVCWVVDPENHDRLRPVGAPGELLIEGPIVARGYLENPMLTAEKFLDSPPAWLHDIRPGCVRTRLYKTGDLVRYKPDGSLHYIGRKDTQVKLRGQRVELSEVETGIRCCMTEIVDLVAETFVPRGASQGQACLVAFICTEYQGERHVNGDSNDTHPFASATDAFHAQVRKCLQGLDKFLPRYMIPDVFIPLERIPTNVSGKANRRLLRELAAKLSWLELATYQPKGEYRQTAMSSSEQVLRDVWARVLNIPSEDIGVSDSFYHLGGDSISAMQVVALARSKGLLTSVQHILRHRTIAGIAGDIQSTDHQVRYEEEVSETPFSLSPIQRLFFDIQADPRQQYNQSFLLRLSSTIAMEDLDCAAQALVRKHGMLRARFGQKPDGQWSQRVMPATATNGSYRCLLQTVPSAGEWGAIFAAAQEAIDIEKGPLFSLDLMNVAGGGAQYLLLVAHHLVIDLVSWRIIFSDLEALLRSPSATATADSSSPLSFQAWYALQEQYSRQHLHPAAVLPPDAASQGLLDPRPFWGLADCKNVMGDRVVERFTVGSELTQQLLGHMNAPLNTRPDELFHAVLLSAFVRAFPDRSEGPLFFVEGHGREPWDAAVDLSETVGWFTTLFPVCVPVSQNTSLIDVLRTVKDTRRTMPHKGWAYFTSRYLHPEGPARLGMRHPAEIIINYAGEYQQLERGDALFIPDRHSILGSLDAADQIERIGLFDISISVRGGCLEFEFMYNRRMSHQQQIKDWIRASNEGLSDACRALAAASPQPTVSDFPLLHLPYEEFSHLVFKTLPRLGTPWENVEDVYPCSPVQRGMLLSQAKDGGLYNIRVTWEVRLHPDTLRPRQIEDAWEEVVSRHPALRSIVVETGSAECHLVQVVLKRVTPDVLYTKGIANGNYIWPRGQPFHQMTLVKTNESFLCHICVNHAMVDAAAMDIIFRDFGLACHNRLPYHPAPAFRDVISHLSQQPGEKAQKYWAEYLFGVHACTFPRLNPANKQRSDGEHIVRQGLPARERLDQFCRTRDVSTWSVICLAWTLVLRSFTHSNDVCFGYIKSARDLPIDNADEIVGPLLNVLPLRMSLGEELTVDTALQSIKYAYLGSLPYQTYALSDMHRMTEGSTQALFNTIVDVQRGGQKVTPDPQVIRKVSKEEVTEYDLVLSVDDCGSQMNTQLRYKTSCVCEEQATSILASFVKALQGIIEGDQGLLDQIELCSEHDKALLWSWNRTVPRSVDACVHDLVSRHHGDQPAVCAWDGDLTYGTLHILSSQLAMYLREQGAGPGVIIPLCFSKSRWTPIAMLAVIKSGAAFVLLDPAHPYQRLKALCSKVDCALIVSAEAHAHLSRDLASNVAVLGDNNTSWPSSATIQDIPRSRPEDMLYIVFTSGSTGSPKGVVIDHRAYCTSAAAHSAVLGLDLHSRVAQFSSYAFDVSIMDHLTTLIAGGCICIPSESQRDDLAEAIRHFRVTHAVLIPSVARLLPAGELGSLRVLGMIGESMTGTDVSQWADRVHLINTYGPAECSVVATAQSAVSLDRDPRNIGHPTGCVCWVVRPESPRQLAAIGAVGELLVEGPIVGRGYFKDPTKSAEAFAPSSSLPWLEEDRGLDERHHSVYRTGDLVRMQPDGTMTFVGRRDTQVKLRGQRIELGEVEEHVRQCCRGAGEVVAEVLVPPGARNPQLVAFVLMASNVASGDSPGDVLAGVTDEFQATVSDTESRLRQAVPAFLTPSVFMPLARIPRTGSGKIDRGSIRRAFLALPAGALDALRGQKGPKVEPTTDAERQLQRIWAGILHLPLEEIGAHDHFFHLGGDSIDAMKVAALCRAGGLAVSVSDIFTRPVLTLLAQASVPVVQLPAPPKPQPFSLSRVGSDPQAVLGLLALAKQRTVSSTPQVVDALPATEVQEFFIRRSTLHYYNFRLRGAVDTDRLRAACDAMMSHFSILRTFFLGRNGHREQLILQQGVDVPFVHYRFNDDLVCRAQALWEEDRSGFDIDRELPVRFILASGSDSDHLFAIRISHAQWDGVSMPFLFHDLAAAYNGLALGPTSAFSDIVYQRTTQQGEAAFNFWRDYLDGATMTIPFPPLPTTPDAPLDDGQSLWHVQETPLPPLPPGITMATLVLAACAVHLARLTSRTDLTFGQTVNGRSMAVENIDVVLGPCLNFIPLRLRLQHSWTVRDLLGHVQEQYVRPLQYDYIELQQIVRHSTRWGEDTDFGFIVQHQNIQLQHELPLQGGVDVEYSLFPQFEPIQEVFVFSEPHETYLEMQVCANSRVLPQDVGDKLVGELCETLELFANNLDMVLPLCF